MNDNQKRDANTLTKLALRLRRALANLRQLRVVKPTFGKPSLDISVRYHWSVSAEQGTLLEQSISGISVPRNLRNALQNSNYRAVGTPPDSGAKLANGDD